MWLDGVSVGRRVSIIACAAGAAAVSAVAALKALRRIRQLLRDENSGEEGYTWAEIVVHKTLASAWIVIHGEVYDVTPFLQEHPGGKVLLLAYAGSDASEPFTSIGHSAMATRALKRLHVGTLRTGSVQKPVEAKSQRSAKILGGYIPPRSKSVEPLWEVKHYGFLPSRDPVPVEALFGTAFEPFAKLAELMPNMCVSGAFRKYIDSNTELQDELRKCTPEEVDRLSEDELERAFSVAGYVVNAYWRGGFHRYGNGLYQNIDLPLPVDGTQVPLSELIPEFLGKPLLHISAKLDRPPRVDYAATVLYNWERIDPDGPIVASNIRCPLRLSGLGDEEWFFKTHVVIESEAAPAVSAVIQLTETEDDRILLLGLTALEEALWRTVRACMPIMYERAERGTEHGISNCNENIFYQVIRPLISTGAVLFEGDSQEGPRFLHGPSGAMSSLMPAVDAALGIQMTSVKLREALDMFEKSMPQGHRDFLKHLRSRDSIRTRIILARPPAGQSDEHHETLVRAYNRCISRVLDFRWQHWQYVKNFIMKPGGLSFATGTGGTSFDYLQQHITDTEHARIAEHGVNFTTIGTPYTAEDPHHTLPPLMGAVHSSSERLSSYEVGNFWSVDGPYGLLAAEPMLGLEDWEQWEQTLPPHLHGAVWELLQLALRLPALCANDGRLYARCEEVKDKLAPLSEDSFASLSEASRERLLTLLCFVAVACRATTPDRKVPKYIDWPYKKASRLAGRPPQIDVVALLLANWTADDLKAPEGGSGATCSNIRSHLRVVCNFVPSPDEAWYRAIHLVLHHEARDLIAAVRAGQAAALTQDHKGVALCLQTMDAWMNKLCDYFDAHFDQKDSRTECVSFARTAKFVAQDLFDIEQTACWVYTMGGSVLLPMLHAILGLTCFRIDSKATSPEVERLRGHLRSWSEEMILFMPIPHRTFLENLQKPGVSLRQYCIKRFGNIKTSVEELHALEVAYNDALNGLVRFLSRRMHLVVRFQPDLSGAFTLLHAHLEATLRKQRLQLLKMRQRVVARLES